jgi:hypothetical protein
LLEQPETAARIGNNARFLVAERHSTEKAIEDLCPFTKALTRHEAVGGAVAHAYPLEKGDKLRAYHLVKRLAKHHTSLFVLPQ